MPGIDYSKWDKLDVSDDEELAAPPRPPVRSSAQPKQRQPPPETWRSRSDEELEAEIAREQAELSRFVREHPCPSAAAVLEWLQDAVQTGALETGSQTLKGLLEGLHLSASALGLFSYEAFEKLYSAGLLEDRHQQKEAQREVGRELHDRGGKPCMILHYYMVNYAMCGAHFFGQIPRAPPVMSYINVVQQSWDGIGEWQM